MNERHVGILYRPRGGKATKKECVEYIQTVIAKALAALADTHESRSKHDASVDLTATVDMAMMVPDPIEPLPIEKSKSTVIVTKRKRVHFNDVPDSTGCMLCGESKKAHGSLGYCPEFSSQRFAMHGESVSFVARAPKAQEE